MQGYVKVPHNFNLNRRLPDRRDYRLALTPPAVPPPDDIDLCGKFMPPVWNQSSLGSCMAHGVNAAYAFVRAKEGLPPLMPDATPSRLFTYYCARDNEGTLDRGDCGSDIRDGVSVLCNQGVPSEALWPYDDNADGKNLYQQKPSAAAYAAAQQDLALQYQFPDQTVIALKTVLASGLPFVFGMMVYPSFESDEVAETGIVPMPGPNESPLGAHCVMGCGCASFGDRVKVRNSYGGQWGRAGYCWVPWQYVADPDLAFDHTVISKVE